MATAIVTIVMFLVLISIHEFGHFIVSKMCGVKVLEFTIGMGPAIFKKQGRETLYSIRILPIGGYCKFEDEVGISDDKRAFCNQAVWKRFLILVAGAVLNIVLGYIICVILVSRAESFATNTIQTIDSNSYLDEAGAMAGDEIISINGHRINFYPDIELYSKDFKEGDTAEIEVKRGNEKLKLNVPLSTLKIAQTYQENGILSISETNGVKVETLIPYDTDVEKKEGMIGQTVTANRIILGFTYGYSDVSVLAVIKEAYHYTTYVVRLVYVSLFDMITGKIGISEMSGPVGIVTAVNTAVNSGDYRIENTLNLIALLTINLGVFNLLPLPALDGGRLLFVIIEVIRRKPIPPEKEALVHVIGMALLLLLTVCITFSDVLKLINK